MVKSLSIKSLYALALAEGEGVGTAYEYFAKRLVLRRWLKKRPSRILIAGLPQKYGSSLDFVQLAAEMGAVLTIVDDRAEALDKARGSLAAAQGMGWLTAVSPTFITITALDRMNELEQSYDLVLSSEVLQRLDDPTRQGYVKRVWEMGTAVALFCPNKANNAHVGISGLNGLHLQELQTLAANSTTHHLDRFGYIDMPPFPPGITRSDTQREQASSGTLEAAAMWGLGIYARLEKWFPIGLRRSRSHIVYALTSRNP